MLDFVANCAGISTVIGSGDYVISAGTTKHRNMVDVLTDGQEVSYYVTPRESLIAGYETGTAVWDVPSSSLVVQSVLTSSNSNAKVSWTVGEKVVYITASTLMLTDATQLVTGTLPYARVPIGTAANTVAAGNDSRFGTVDIGDLTQATSIDGTELLPADQGGNGVSITPQQIIGDPYAQIRGLEFDRFKGYTACLNMRTTYSSTTNDTLIEGNPFVLYRGGAAAGASNGIGTYLAPTVVLTTGTDNTGYAVAVHTDTPYIFIAGSSELDQRWSILIPALPTGAEDFTLQVGFVAGFAALAVQGIYLELTSASPNWFACVKNAAGTERVNTNIAATTGVTTARVAYSGTSTESQYWINGVATLPIDDSTRAVDAFQPLGMAAGIRKTFGTTPRTLVFGQHKYDNARAAVPYFG